MKTNSSKNRSDTSSFVSCNDLYDDSSVEMESDHKRKNRNLSEKKRRDQFNILINELCSMVHLDANGQIVIDPQISVIPSPGGSTNGRRMDKSTVLQSAINFLKSHCEANKSGSVEGSSAGAGEEMRPKQKKAKDVKDSWKPASLSYEEFAQLMLEAMDAFIVIMEADSTGNIVYASESILPLLGYDPSLFFHQSGCYNDEEIDDGNETRVLGQRTGSRKADQSISKCQQKNINSSQKMSDRAISDYLNRMNDEFSAQFTVNNSDGNFSNGRKMGKAIQGGKAGSNKRSKNQLTFAKNAGLDNAGGTSIFDLVHESERSLFFSFLSHHHRDPLLDPYNSIILHFKRLDETSEVSYEVVRLFGSFTSINDGDKRVSLSSVPVKTARESSNGNFSKVGITGRSSKEDSKIGISNSITPDISCFVSIGRLQTPKILKELRMIIPPNGEVQINREFVSRHSLEWKFLFLDHRASSLIGYMPFEVLGTSGYEYYHWDDLPNVLASHSQLMETGEGTTDKYRFLTKGQQWIWLRTRSYITYHQWNSKPEFIVCTHTIIGYNERSMTAPDRLEKKSNTHRMDSLHNDRYHNNRNTSYHKSPSSISSSLDPFCFPMDFTGKASSASRKSLFTHHPLDVKPSPMRQVTNHYLPVEERANQPPRDSSQGSSSQQQTRKRKSRRNHPDSTLKTGASSLESGASSTASSNTSSNVPPTASPEVSMLPDSSANNESVAPMIVQETQAPSNHIQPLSDFITPSVQVPMENTTNLFNSNSASTNNSAMVTYLTLKCKGKDNNSPRSKSFNYLSNSSADFLKRRHQLLQDHILQQQEELRRVEHQLSHNHDSGQSNVIMGMNDQEMNQVNQHQNMYTSSIAAPYDQMGTNYHPRNSLSSSGNSFISSDNSPSTYNHSIPSDSNIFPEY